MIFKQLLQAGAIDFLNLDACRVAGVNENVAILLLAAKLGSPVPARALPVKPVETSGGLIYPCGFL